MHIKIYIVALAGVAQWLEHQPTHRRVLGSIPSQVLVPGLQVCSLPQGWVAWGRQQINVFLSPSLPLTLSLKGNGKKYPPMKMNYKTFFHGVILN